MIDGQVCDYRLDGALIVIVTDFDRVGISPCFKYDVILLCEVLIDIRRYTI